MMKKFLTGRNIEVFGWICGLITATLFDYYLIPIIKNKTGKMSIAISVGLISGIVIISIFVLTALFFTKKLNNNKTKKKRSKFNKRISSKIIISFISIFIVLTASYILWKFVIEPGQTVAEITMNNKSIRKITINNFKKRLFYEQVKYRKMNNLKTYNTINTNEIKDYEYSFGFGASVIQRMTSEIIILEEAEKRNLSVKKEELDTCVLSPELKPEVIKNICRAEILESKLRKAFYEDIRITQERVRLKLIRFENEADARQTAENHLTSGDFSSLYEKAIKGKIKNATGMIRDWSKADELLNDFGLTFTKTIFDMAPGKYTTQLINAAGGWYLVQVLGHEKQKMTEEWRKQRGEDNYLNWLANAKKRIKEYPVWMKVIPKNAKVLIPDSINSKKKDKILDDLKNNKLKK